MRVSPISFFKSTSNTITTKVNSIAKYVGGKVQNGIVEEAYQIEVEGYNYGDCYASQLTSCGLQDSPLIICNPLYDNPLYDHQCEQGGQYETWDYHEKLYSCEGIATNITTINCISDNLTCCRPPPFRADPVIVSFFLLGLSGVVALIYSCIVFCQKLRSRDENREVETAKAYIPDEVNLPRPR